MNINGIIDHNWHEFDYLNETREEAIEKLSIEEFLLHIQKPRKL